LDRELVIKLLQPLYGNQQPPGELVGRLLQVVLLAAMAACPASEFIKGLKARPRGDFAVKDIMPKFMGDREP
jgi:hypothetical protein